MPRQVFTAGEILTAAEMNDLADATVMVFDDSAARGSAIPTPSEGMVTYLKDEDKLFQYDGSNFVAVSQPGILQVVSTAKTDTFSSSSTSFTDITGLSASITPTSSSSKVLVMVDTKVSVAANNSEGVFLALSGGNSASYIGDTAGSRVSAAAGWNDRQATGVQLNLAVWQSSIIYLDAPATTSATTYNVQIRSAFGNAVVVNKSTQDTDSARGIRTASSITVMEVAG
jgi:hypothetical protein